MRAYSIDLREHVVGRFRRCGTHLSSRWRIELSQRPVEVRQVDRPPFQRMVPDIPAYRRHPAWGLG